MHEGFAGQLKLPNITFNVGSRDSSSGRTITDIRIQRYEKDLVDFVLWLKNDDETLIYMSYSYSGPYQIFWGARDYDSELDTFRGHSMEEAWTQQED